MITNRFLLLAGLASCVLVASACESNVTGDAGSGATSAGGDSNLDQGCYDACVAKGVSTTECTDFCTDDTGKGAGAGGSGKTTNGVTVGGGGDDVVDIELEKSCYQCWEDNSEGACGDAFVACEKSLACLELRNCPFTCGVKPGCVDECNEIIPTGVEPLTALAQCMVCEGGPCATACQDSITREYCD